MKPCSLSKNALAYALLLQSLVYISSAHAQSWSSWKQLADEQNKAGKLSEAEHSWQAAYQLVNETHSKDSRLYISGLELAKVLITENKKDEAFALLKSLSIDVNLDCTDAAECLRLYMSICNEKQDTAESARTQALLQKYSQIHKTQTETGSERQQVSLVFGESAKDDLHKKLGIVHQSIKEKNFTAAEAKLVQALTMAKAAHSLELSGLVLREQGKLFCITKDYKKAEEAYRSLLDLVKQQDGPETQTYIEVLGTHARILRLLGQTALAASEETKCAAISEKFKITSSGAAVNWASSNDAFPNNSILSRNPGAQTRLQNNSAPRQIALAPRAQTGNTSRVNGRLKVIEFYTTW
jgi:hypothetical protein